jgi:hypothetical protein
MRCGAPLLLVAILAAPQDGRAQSLDGVWQTKGYGYVFEVKGNRLQAFEVTAKTCVPGFTATRDSTATTAGREVTFKTADGNVFFARPGGTADHKRLHSDGSASDMRIDRIATVPAACTPPTKNTPVDNFEVFTRTWGEQYILFDQKRTDWNRVVEANRSKVIATTPPTALFDVFEGMIKPFEDAHTFIGAKDIDRQYRALRSGTDRLIKGNFNEFRTKGMPALLGITERAWLHAPLRKWCNDQVQFGRIDDSTGYLRILSFSGYAKGDGFAAGMTALEAALDTIFSGPKLAGLVIDVRINFGGADPYGLAIASRLATAPYLAYVKEARADPIDRNQWTPGDSSIVRPSTRPGFRGSVVELTSGLTISAGETFTQALMGRKPAVVRLGENTQGVFSDVLGRTLPNGWRFGLPNEVFRAPNGSTFDGPGIPPDVALPVFADQDVAAGKDPGVAKALEILRNGKGTR